MAIVIHTINGSQYAYNHHREGKKVVCDYIGKAGGSEGGGDSAPVHMSGELTQQKDLSERHSSYGQKLALGYVSTHGGVQIWKSQGATSEQISQVKNMIDRQPLAVRSTVEHVEVFGNDESHKFEIGGVEFKAAAHWSQKVEGNENYKDNIMRIFGTQGEGVLYHESGHSMYSKLHQDSLKETYSSNISNRIIDKVMKYRLEKVQEVRSKFEPLIDAQFEKMNKASRAHDAVVFDYNIKPEEKKQLEKNYKKERGKVDKLEKQKQKEIEEIRTRFDPYVAAERYKTSKAPTQRKLGQFHDASWEEGGISDYTQAYQKAKSPEFVNENFAEATNYFFSGKPATAQAYREKYPKTWAAYRAIVEPQIIGAATEMKYKPKEWLL